MLFFSTDWWEKTFLLALTMALHPCVHTLTVLLGTRYLDAIGQVCFLDLFDLKTKLECFRLFVKVSEKCLIKSALRPSTSFSKSNKIVTFWNRNEFLKQSNIRLPFFYLIHFSLNNFYYKTILPLLYMTTLPT